MSRARLAPHPPSAVAAGRMRRRRAPVLALGLVALFAGLWGGLLLLGLSLPDDVMSASEAHGPLMALGFLGTLISLERAVALGRWWSYAAPWAAGLGAIATIADDTSHLGPALLTFAGLVLVADHVVLQRIAPSRHNVVMCLGALAWSAAGVDWLTDADVSRFAPLLAGFLVLIIVGERLELTRTVRLSSGAQRLLLIAVAVFSVGLLVSLPAETLGVRVAGVGLLGQAAWLARYDIARRTVRMGGVTRFMASALLAGYVWLAVAGALWAWYASMIGGGAVYDASLHAVFLGFVMSMVFAHAPVIVPAVLRVSLPFHRGFYVHLLLLQVSLALRLLGGDLAGNLAAWQWGGVLNEAAMLLFLAVSAITVLHASRPISRGPTKQARLSRLREGATHG